MTKMKTFVLISTFLAASTLALTQDHAQHEMTDGDQPASTPRDGSGTSWMPASSPMEMLHLSSSDWSFMVHGFANFAYQEESEPRGASEFFSTNMAMFPAAHGAGKGDFRFRFMASLEPTLGRTGYPLLFQTGETADSVNPLFDRQHPRDLLMEVALRYDRPIGTTDALFVYFVPFSQRPGYGSKRRTRCLHGGSGGRKTSC